MKKDIVSFDTGMRRSLFICPICRQSMEHNGQIYRCLNGHSYDISREGYVNLLPANRRHSDMPGDDRNMVDARTRFLDGGWYEPLRNELCRLTERFLPEHAALIDAGCGEGYYTEALSNVAIKRSGAAAGIDLSKTAVRRSAKRCRETEIAVASVYHMPLADDTADLLLNCFAPLAADEFHRILKPGGTFLYVVPGEKHLWEMKEILYDHPYRNEQKTEDYDGFQLIGEFPLRFQCRLREQKDIAALFQMTPYAWKTPKDGVDRLMECREMNITAQFRIFAFERDSS